MNDEQYQSSYVRQGQSRSSESSRSKSCRGSRLFASQLFLKINWIITYQIEKWRGECVRDRGQQWRAALYVIATVAAKMVAASKASSKVELVVVSKVESMAVSMTASMTASMAAAATMAVVTVAEMERGGRRNDESFVKKVVAIVVGFPDSGGFWFLIGL